MKEGKRDKALAALEYCDKVIPSYNVPYDYQNGSVQMATAYYQLDKTDRADNILVSLADKEVEYMTYYLSLDDYRFSVSVSEFEYHTAVLDRIVTVMETFGSDRMADYDSKLNELYGIYRTRVK